MTQEYANFPMGGNRIRAYSVLFQAINANQAGYSVLSGMDPSRVSATSVVVASGSYRNNAGQVKPFSQSYLNTIPAVATGKHRYDLIVMDCTNDTLTRVTGTEDTPTHILDFLENVTPSPPDLPNKKCILIGIICIDQNGVRSTNNGDVTVYSTAGVADLRKISPVPGSEINSATAKATPVDTDVMGLWDGALKKFTIANLKTLLSSVFAPIAHASATISVHSFDSSGQAVPSGHASRHISTGNDAIAGAVAGGASGLLTGADKSTIDHCVNVRNLLLTFNNGVLAFSPGILQYITMDLGVTMTLTSAEIDVAPSGSIVVDLWKCSDANYNPGTHPVDSDSITSATPLTISNGVKVVDNTLTNWTKTFAAGDKLAINIDSCTSVTMITLRLKFST